MTGTPSRPEYSIAAASKMAGVSCHSLRIWERRYGFPAPHRTASGHRRYGPDQVHALRRIARLMRQGRSIGELIAALHAGRLDAVEAGPEGDPALSEPSKLLALLASGDLDGAEDLYARATAPLSPIEVISNLIEPALIEIGERGFRGDAEVYQERFVSAFLVRKLHRLLDEATHANGIPRSRALVATVQGDRHEGGLIIISLLLELAGWRALSLGTDLPVREIERAVEALHPDAIALSFVLSRNINKRFCELSRIQGIPVFVGGRSILNYQGLARRHGLIPVTGTAAEAIPRLLAEQEIWAGRRVSVPNRA